MKKHEHMTAGELAGILALMPADMPVQFSPITDAWLGASHPMRIRREMPAIYSADGCRVALPTDEGAEMYIHIFEDDTEEGET